MTITREKIMEKRKRLELQKAKDETKLKALQLKLKKVTSKITKTQKNEELKKKIIIGTVFLNKTKIDQSFKVWLDGELASSDLSAHEKSLFGIAETGSS